MRYSYISILVIFNFSLSIAQEKTIAVKDFYIFKNEIGINFTNVLGNVLSLNPNNANSPYGLTYRRHFADWSLRTAININVSNLNENDFENGFFLTRKLNLLNINSRVGAEKHLTISKRVMFSYGVDALLGYENERSEINSFNQGSTFFINKDKTYGLGLGPLLRIEYKISDRLFLSTESTLYAYYSVKTSELSLNGVIDNEPQKTNFQLKLVLPQSLFINISF